VVSSLRPLTDGGSAANVPESSMDSSSRNGVAYLCVCLGG